MEWKVVTVSIVFVAVISSILLNLALKQRRQRIHQYSIFTGGNSKGYDVFSRRLYDFAGAFFLTKRFVKRVRKNYELIYPGDELKIVVSTVKTLVAITVIVMIAAFFLLVRNFSFYGNCTFILTVYFVINEFVDYMIGNKIIQLLKELDKFITDIRHYYFEHEMVDEAVEEALNEAGPLIKLHGRKIYDILISTNIDGDILDYNDSTSNRFLRTLLANCAMVAKNGDSKTNGESIFLTNLRDLKREISIEVRKKEKSAHSFAGLNLVCIAPMYAMPFCKKWCISNVPSLNSLFNSSIGIILQIAIFLVTVITYLVLRSLKDDSELYDADHPILDYLMNYTWIAAVMESITSKNYSKTLRLQNSLKRTGAGISVEKFYIKRFLFTIAAFIGMFGIMLYGIKLDKSNCLETVLITDSSANAFTSSDYQRLEVTAKKYITEYLNSGFSQKTIEENIINAGIFRYNDAAVYCAGIVSEHITEYHNIHFSIMHFLVTIFAAGMGYMLPYILLLIKEKRLIMQMDDEVIQFQSVILMLIHLPNISAEMILEWLCNFAVIFRSSIAECLDNFPAGDIEALEKLLEDEPHIGFQRIVKNLIACDRIGVEAAFNEISADRLNYQESRKQENEIELEKKSNTGMFIAFFPLYAVIIFYLAGPFVYGAMNMFGQTSSMFSI